MLVPPAFPRLSQYQSCAQTRPARMRIHENANGYNESASAFNLDALPSLGKDEPILRQEEKCSKIYPKS